MASENGLRLVGEDEGLGEESTVITIGDDSRSQTCWYRIDLHLNIK